MNKKITKTIDTLKLNIDVLGKCISPFLIHKELDRSKLIQFYSENQSSYFMILMMIDSISIDLKKSFTGPLDTLLRIENIQAFIWKLNIEFRNFMESSLSTGGTLEERTELQNLINQISTDINSMKNNQNEGLNSDD